MRLFGRPKRHVVHFPTLSNHPPTIDNYATTRSLPPPNAPQLRLDVRRVLRDPREHVTLPNPFCFTLESEADQQAWLAKEKETESVNRPDFVSVCSRVPSPLSTEHPNATRWPAFCKNMVQYQTPWYTAIIVSIMPRHSPQRPLSVPQLRLAPPLTRIHSSSTSHYLEV
ncbi:hypothetical protein FRC03_010040 [Tulasnella sp. 419]|nr:hypothetical protein FRC03_010040 [Tulasnella sp. 419]